MSHVPLEILRYALYTFAATALSETTLLVKMDRRIICSGSALESLVRAGTASANQSLASLSNSRMPIIVEHRSSRKRYYLIGAGFGISHASKPHWFFGNNVSHETIGEAAMLAVCDKNGRIGWFESSDMRVVEIDGMELVVEKEIK